MKSTLSLIVYRLWSIVYGPSSIPESREKLMANRKSQQKAGLPEKPRGQETGRAGRASKDRQAKAETPSLRGRRKKENEYFADESAQHVASDASKPSTNQPSVPAAIPTDTRMSETGGERAFKKRQKRG
jgi:hypothetical protein